MAKKLTSSKAKEILHDKSVHGHPLTDKQRKFFGAIAGGAQPYEQGGLILKKKTKDNYGTKPNANDSNVSIGPNFVGQGYTAYNWKSPAWGGQFQMGGSMPGSVGFMYARTQNPAPSNGKYTKKTQASAQNGQEMKYYQDGLDFKPKSISKNGKKLSKAAMGKSMVYDQLHQLTDFGNPPIAQDGTWLSGVPGLGTSQATFDSSTGMFDSAKGFVTKADTDALSGGASAAKGFNAGGAGMAGLQSIDKIIGGIQAIGEQKKAQKKAQQSAELSGLALTAQQTTQQPKRKYVRPEDALVQPGQLGNPYGSGTNYLAQNGRAIDSTGIYTQRMLSNMDMADRSSGELKNKFTKAWQKDAADLEKYKQKNKKQKGKADDGATIGGNPTEIQNIYNPGDIYTDGGYEPIESQNIKQYKHGGMHKAEFGEYFQDSGQAQIGSAVGGAIAQGFGLPPQVGELVGKVAGNLLGGAKDARKLQAQKDKTALNQSMLGFEQARSQGPLSSFMKYGGSMDSEHKWVSNGWQPQVIAKFGEYNVKDLLQPPHDADMLRAGGHLKEYTAPSAAALSTERPDMPHAQFGLVMGPINKELMNPFQNSEKANKLKQVVSSGIMEGGGRMTSTNMMFDTDKYPRAKHGSTSDMSGDLQVLDGGKAETISFNPYLPEGGETVMFKGRSHDNGGIPISYGENGVEVEGGEPAVKLQDGGQESNMVVFGNMKLSQMAADEFGIPDAKGKKFKHVANDISKVERKQNKLIDKATETADMTTGNSGFDQLKLNTSQAQLMGANMKLRSAAILKQNLAAVQNAILDTASELGVKSDELAQGKLVKETDKRMMAQTGTNIPYSGSPFTDAPDLYPGPTGRDIVNNIMSSALKGVPSTEEYTKIPYQPGYGMTSNLPEVTVTSDKLSTTNNIDPIANVATSGKGGFDWKGLGQMALSNVAPFLTPRTKLGLDPEELYPEYYALATNQLEPVQAQTYQPMLDTPYDISLNDQLAAIDSQSRAAIRAAGSNPAAQAMIMSQSLEAKNKVLGEQSRINQANKMQVYDKNRAMLNDAQLKNLQILDQQYVRQAQAKSNTKAQTLEALKSIAVKTAQNKLENQTLNVYENMYKYRFSPSGVAYSANEPAQFNIPNIGNIENLSTSDKSKIKDLYEKIVSRDKAGNVTGSKEKTSTSKTSRNGSIVQALKNL